MIEFVNEKDVAKITAPLSKIVQDTIGEIARVLVPAIAEAAKGVVSGVTVTVGPITIEPIKITVGAE